MPRLPKNYTNLTCRLATDASDKLQIMVDKTERTKTVIVERAIREYYDNHFGDDLIVDD